MDRSGQDLIDQCVRNILIGEVADRTLVAKQLMHVDDRLHRAPPYGVAHDRCGAANMADHCDSRGHGAEPYDGMTC